LAVNPRFRLKKILERQSQRSKQHYTEVEVVKDYEALLHDDALELLVINTPNALHFEMAHKALLAGKHIVIEKPFTVTTREAEILIELAQKQDRVLTVFQNRRWDGDFLTVQKVVSEKLLGQLVEYEAHYDRFLNYIAANTWKEEAGPGSGLLYNLGSHMIDQTLVLFGKPQAITAATGIRRPGGQVDDYYDITLHYEELKAVLKSSLLVRELGPRYILHGTEGSFIKYGIDPQEEALKAGHKPTGPDWGKDHQSEWGKLNTPLNGLHVTGTIETLRGSYSKFYDNLYGVIRKGKELAVKPEEAALVIELIELALQSNEEGRTIKLKPKDF
jgi:predicted dehydrogenase